MEFRGLWLVMIFLLFSGAAGCRSEIGGHFSVVQPPYDENVQYFAPGPEFKLSREAAAQKVPAAEQNSGA